MKTLYKALANFQQEVPIIHKDTQGYGYSYADLPKILEVINPILVKHNLGFTQPISGNTIKTIVFHTETGESIESEIAIPQGVSLKGMNDFQVLGSAITYLRRYALSSILGLVTDKDIDASSEQKRDAKKPLPLPPLKDSVMEKIINRSAQGDTIKLSDLLNHYTITEEQRKILNQNNIL